MVVSKSQPNKMDSEPIIDMGPVYQEKKIKNNNLYISFSKFFSYDHFTFVFLLGN